MKFNFNKVVFNVGIWGIFMLLLKYHIHHPVWYSGFILSLLILVSCLINPLEDSEEK